MTLSNFRMNTYAKKGGGGVPRGWVFPRLLCDLCAPASELSVLNLYRPDWLRLSCLLLEPPVKPSRRRHVGLKVASGVMDAQGYLQSGLLEALAANGKEKHGVIEADADFVAVIAATKVDKLRQDDSRAGTILCVFHCVP